MPGLYDKVIIVGADGTEATVVGGALTTSGGGGGGGGGAVTVADAADVTQGAIADAAVAAGAAGTLSAKLRTITGQLAGGLPAALVGGRLSVDVGVSALPSGGATAALQTSGNTLLAGGLPAALAAGGGLKVEGVAGGFALPVSSTTLATVAKQPALGTSGTPSADVLTVQGAASMTALHVDGETASDAPVTGNPLLGGGRASTAVPSAVSTDGDKVATWMTRTGAAVVDGGVAAGATDSGNPIKIGGRYNTTKPTLTDGQRGDIQLGSRGAVTVQLSVSDSSQAILPLASISSDGAAGAGSFAAGLLALNGSGTWDRVYNNVSTTLLASAARTVATSSADQTNFNGNGVIIVINVTAEAGTTTLTLTVQGKDSISSNYYDLITGVIVYNAATDTPTVTRAVMVYPGILTADAIGAGNANLISAKSLVLPRTWRATITPSDASSQTYSVSAVTVL